MTSAVPMPVIPDPESEDVLLRMLELILEHPSRKKFNSIELDVSLKLNNGSEKDYHFKDKASLIERRKIERIINVRRKYHELPIQREGAQATLKIIRRLRKEKRTELPEVLQDGEFISLILDWHVVWEKFNEWMKVKATMSSNTRKLEIGYYPNVFDKNTRVWDENGYLSHLTEPFINLFQQFKSMFHKEWPGKYIILPSISDRKERALILSELRKEPFEPSKYKKIDEFLSS